MKRLKDTEIKYKINLKVIQKHIKEDGFYSNIPYLLSISIDKGYGSTSTCFPYTKKGKRDLIKFLKEECSLNSI